MSKKVCIMAASTIKQPELALFINAAVEQGCIPLAPQTVSFCTANNADIFNLNYAAFEYVNLADELWLCGNVIDDKMQMLKIYAEAQSKPAVTHTSPDV
jgi:hypothetical protein